MRSNISLFLQKLELIIIKTLTMIPKMIFQCMKTILFIPLAVKEAFNESYFPELQRKSAARRIMDNLVWDILNKRANGFYNLYAMDLVGNEGIRTDYLDENEFWNGLMKQNYKNGITSQVTLLRDKYLFYIFLHSYNIPTPDVFAVISNKKIYNDTLEPIEWSSISNEKNYFIKDTNGECASFVKYVDDYETLIGLRNKLGEGRYILQKSVVQHHDMNQLNPSAINTLRIVTMYNKGKPELLSVLLRVGTSHSGNVDNWAAGGLAIGVQADGYLKKYGFYKPGCGLKAEEHPDTKVVFNEFKVPMLAEAIEAALNAHKLFYTVGTIGWDVAITEDGPVFIEGNDNYEITLMQAVDGGLKTKWNVTVQNPLLIAGRSQHSRQTQQSMPRRR